MPDDGAASHATARSTISVPVYRLFRYLDSLETVGTFSSRPMPGCSCVSVGDHRSSHEPADVDVQSTVSLVVYLHHVTVSGRNPRFGTDLHVVIVDEIHVRGSEHTSADLDIVAAVLELLDHVR